MCSKSPPAMAPGPSIESQTAGNIATAKAQGIINNPDMVNQFGSSRYTSGDKFNQSGRDTLTHTLNPKEQAIFDANQGNRLALNKLANTATQSAQGIIGEKLDFSGAPAAPGSSDEVRKRVIDAMMSRSDSALGRANNQQDSDLVAAGIRPGTEAWDRVKGEQGRNRNDAFQQAELAGGNAAQQEFGMGTDARRNYISELLAKRSVPLNEITALMSGSQTQNPFAGQGGGGGVAQVKPTDYFANSNMLNQYNMNAYNQQVGQGNAWLSAGAMVGAGALTA